MSKTSTKIIGASSTCLEVRHSIHKQAKADGCFFPKEENSQNIEQFRTISLCVEGKFFFAILAKQLTAYLLGNNDINYDINNY